MREFFGENWGNLASVAGLVFSFLAFLFSKRASKAAQESRNSARRQSLGEEMIAASQIAKEIVTFVGIERGEVALLRANELIARTSYLLARWNSVLLEESTNNLNAAQERLQKVHDALMKNPIANLSPTDKRGLTHACQSVSKIFSEEHGNAVRAVDERG